MRVIAGLVQKKYIFWTEIFDRHWVTKGKCFIVHPAHFEPFCMYAAMNCLRMYVKFVFDAKHFNCLLDEFISDTRLNPFHPYLLSVLLMLGVLHTDIVNGLNV